jgi:hypothetical protein
MKITNVGKTKTKIYGKEPEAGKDDLRRVAPPTINTSDGWLESWTMRPSQKIREISKPAGSSVFIVKDQVFTRPRDGVILAYEVVGLPIGVVINSISANDVPEKGVKSGIDSSVSVFRRKVYPYDTPVEELRAIDTSQSVE